MSFLTLLKRKAKKAKGSLTVEAAIVLPIFLFAMISIIYFCEIFRYSCVVSESIHQAAKAMAKIAYVSKDKQDIDNGVLEGVVLSEIYVKNQVNSNLESVGIKQKNNSYYLSRIMKDDLIDLIVIEKINIPYGFLGISSIKVMDRARVHVFNGYDNTKAQKVSTEESNEIVYITKNGTVYHKDRNCSHLKITISNTVKENINKKRNINGGKYYPCEFCDNKSVNCFYTEYGDRYHSSVSCPALKRNIISVNISETKGRRKCKSCGG